MKMEISDFDFRRNSSNCNLRISAAEPIATVGRGAACVVVLERRLAVRLDLHLGLLRQLVRRAV